jgi:hypothetical protein
MTQMTQMTQKQMKYRIAKNTIQELNIQPLIVAIPDYKSFFYTFHTVGLTSIGHLDDDGQYMESAIRRIKDGYVLLTSDNININATAAAANNSIAEITNIKRLVDTYLHLTRGIQLLIPTGIIHTRICFQNIVFKDGVLPLLTGFEYASVDAMPIAPIECRTIRHILKHNLTSISASTIYDISPDNKEEQTFLSKYINKPTAYIIEEMKGRKNTWNLYSLNELILGMLERDNGSVFLSKWKQCLRRGISVDDRETPDYFIRQTKELMYSADLAELTTPTTTGSSSLV